MGEITKNKAVPVKDCACARPRGGAGVMFGWRLSSFARAVLAAVLFVAVCAVGQEDGGDDPGEGGYDAPYFQADFTQDLNSWTSTLVNPALTYRVNQMHAAMAFYRWGLDRGNLGYQDFTFLYPIRLRHTAGLTLLHARNAIEEVKYVGGTEGDPEMSGRSVPYQDIWFVGSYAYRALPWMSVGANIKLRSQAQFGTSAFSRVPGLDVGVYFNPIDHYHWGDLGISLTAQDILPTQTPWQFNLAENPSFSASDLITVSRGRVGLRYSGLNDNLVASFEMLVDNAFRDIFARLPWNEFKEAIMSGSIDDLPSASEIADMFPIAFRWGFHVKYMFIPQIWFKGGWTNNNIPYLGFNYNLLYPLPEMINFISLDYNFGYSFIERSADLNDERGLVMMLRASADFGRTREQKESRRMFNKLVLAPNDTYQEAMRLYMAGRHWEAAFAFGKLITLYPSFHLNDKAVYYLGDCYKQMYMNNTAREVFREALDEYTTSDMRAFYLYGVMSLDYREENYEEAMRNHSFIINLYPESEIVGEAEYLAGEIAFIHDDLETARKHLELVKPTDPSYLYALYTLSIVNHETDRLQAAVQNLRVILQDTTTRSADQKLKNAAAVKLGHVHYEQGNLREAVEAYMFVRENADPSGDEALLGMAWAWVRAGQPQQALQRVDKILALHPNSPFIPEAYLLKGYILSHLQRHAQSIPMYERAVALAESNQFITNEHVVQRTGQYVRASNEFAPTSDRIKRNAFRRPTPRSIEERTELRTGYDAYAKESQEFFEYRLRARHHRNFFMRKDDIIEDAAFALAKATAFLSASGQPGELERIREAARELDDEIEALRRALEAEGSQ